MTTTRPQPASRQPDIFRETHRRRAAVFAAVFAKLAQRSEVSNLHVVDLQFDRSGGRLVRSLSDAAVASIAGSAPYGYGPDRDAWQASAREARPMGCELRFRFVATVEGEQVRCDIRARAQARRRNDYRTTYEPLNKLVLWHGRHARTRGYGNETRRIEPARGYDIDKIVDDVVAWFASRVEEARRDRERAERVERERAERRAREAIERERREANRRELDALRREAELMLGLDGISIEMNHRGTFSVRYNATGIQTAEQLRDKLRGLSAMFAPPPPAAPENDPDEDDDTDWIERAS